MFAPEDLTDSPQSCLKVKQEDWARMPLKLPVISYRLSQGKRVSQRLSYLGVDSSVQTGQFLERNSAESLWQPMPSVAGEMRASVLRRAGLGSGYSSRNKRIYEGCGGQNKKRETSELTLYRGPFCFNMIL